MVTTEETGGVSNSAGFFLNFIKILFAQANI